MMVTILLREGSLRFSELRDRARGITPKVLTHTLRGLERDGLIEREVFAEVPPRVEYRLTPLGRSLDRAVDGIRTWAETHIGEMARAQTEYDRQAAARSARRAESSRRVD